MIRIRKPLWIPSEKTKKGSNVAQFINFINENYGGKVKSYPDLFKWSTNNSPSFWKAMWKFGEIICSSGYDEVVDDLENFPGAKWFIGAKLNFAQNLLRHRNNQLALIFKEEDDEVEKISYSELYFSVSRLANKLRELKVTSTDIIAGYMPNIKETIIAMLAATSVGAAWASCGTELGPGAVQDRLSQIGPKILFTVDGHSYKGKKFNDFNNIKKIARGLPSLEKIVVVPYQDLKPDLSELSNSIYYNEFISKEKEMEILFEQVDFSNPLYIMFSSGTTGKPKCMVQGVGGVLLNHLKELIIHTDLKRNDKILYITTPSWMMWNWLVSSLAVGATVVLYDGNPNYPDWKTIWRFIQDEKITIFGCSASYINYLRKMGANPGKVFDLSALREISQTGSVLSAKGFEYVYREIKELHFNSISGGTDINGCFAAGTPIQPVYAGEIQGPALGMQIKAYNESGESVIDEQGELVCEKPCPSMPLYFWNDSEGKKYKDAYFSVYPGIWRHGDWVLIHSETGGITFCGRSDFVLKPSGVRIGPAEIYNVVERFEEIEDSVVVGKDVEGDQLIILFVKLSEGFCLTDNLKAKIKNALKKEASPRHVPALIFKTSDIPYTYNMKKVESVISNIINGRPLTNKDVLMNPESLQFFEGIKSRINLDGQNATS